MLARDSPNDLSYRNTADTWLAPPALPLPGLGRAGSGTAAALSSGSQNFRPGEGGEQGSMTVLANLSFFWLKKQSQQRSSDVPKAAGPEDGRAGHAGTSSPDSPPLTRVAPTGLRLPIRASVLLVSAFLGDRWVRLKEWGKPNCS